MITTTTPGTGRPAQVAGLAPSAERVRRAKGNRWVALAIYGTPLVLLMIGMYLRPLDSAHRLELGWFFGYVFPLMVVAILAALLWALIVEPYSRGNTLGDHLRSQRDVDTDTVERDQELLGQGRAAAQDGRKHAESGRVALIAADEEIAGISEIGHRALQIAHGALGVATIGRVRPENMIVQGFPQQDRIERAITVELARTNLEFAALEDCHLPPVESLDSTHLGYATPPVVAPDLAFVIPAATMAPCADLTLGFPDQQVSHQAEPPSNRRLIIARAVAVVLVTGSAIWFFTGRSSDVAAEATGIGVDAVVSGTVAGTSFAAPTAGVIPQPGVASATISAPTVSALSVDAPTASALSVSALSVSALSVSGSAGPQTLPVPVGIREGIDYNFKARMKDGALVRWDCSTPITVRLAGPAPAGAQRAVEEAVRALRGATNLPMQMGAPLSVAIVEPEQVATNEIVYNYLSSEQIVAAGLDLTVGTLGLGGARHDELTGRIISGWVGITIGNAEADPSTMTGRETVWHEGAHTVNLDHSVPDPPSPEIMAPKARPDEVLAWGVGDSYALASVGCAVPSTTG